MKIYIREHSGADFSYGICLEDAKEVYKDILKTNEKMKLSYIVRRNRMIFILCIVTISFWLISNTSYAFKQADLDKLMATKQCEWCDLSNANLSNAQLSDAQLSNANLSHANLSNTDLSNANLSGAFLSNANLQNSNLSGAFLSGAYMRGSDLSKANLSRAKLQNANILDANLTEADLSNANLSGATWKDGRKCEEGSIKECKTGRTNRGGGRGLSGSSRQSRPY